MSLDTPTSPVLANLSALEMDQAIMRLCDNKVGSEHYNYSRYVDDITISGIPALIDLLPK